MNGTVKIMDLDVDILTEQAYLGEIQEYLRQAHLKTMVFLTAKMVEEAVENVEYCNILKHFDMILPGEEDVLSLHHVNVLKAGGMITNCDCFYSTLKMLEEEQKTVYLIGENFSKLEHFMAFCEDEYPELNVVGSYIEHMQKNEEILLNDINTISPEVVIIALSAQAQARWMKENGSMLNTKLCICVGGVFDKISELYSGANQSFLYRTFYRTKKNFQSFWQKRIFKMEVEYYNSRNRND